MNALAGAALLLCAAVTLLVTFRSDDDRSRAALSLLPARVGRRRSTVVGQGVVDMSDRRQRPDYLSATSAREIHRLLSDALENRIDGRRRHGLALRLERAGSNMKVGEWLFLSAAMGAAGFVGGTVALNLGVGLVAGLIGMSINHFRLTRKINGRERAFNDQLAESLQLMAGSLRAGQSLAQTLHNLVTDAPSPSSEEFRRVMTETRLGRDLTEALYAMAQRMNSEDFEWVVGAIDINRTTGGDLAVILDRVSETIRQRDRLRGQVRSLSAEGRLSGWVVGMLPPGVFCFVFISNRAYMEKFFESPRGFLMLGLAAGLLITGATWLRHLSKPVY